MMKVGRIVYAPDYGVNKVCATCSEPCKQGVAVGLISCPRYSRVSIPPKPMPKTSQNRSGSVEGPKSMPYTSTLF